MNWRTDKPTADNIVAKVEGKYLTLYKFEDEYYVDDYALDEPYLIPYDSIEKWADLEEDENPTKTLFEKCLANINPEVWQEVSDRVDEAIKTGKQLQDIEDETVTDCHELEEEVKKYINDNWECEHSNENSPLFLYDFSDKDLLDAARHFAEWGAEHTFTHHETDESLQEAVTHQMEDDQTIDDYVRKGLDEVCLRYAELGAKWGAEHRDRFLNWIRDLIKKGIEKPEEALNILKRIDALINDDSLWGEHLKK